MVCRRHRGDMIETLKIMHGLSNVDCTLCFILSHHVLTREHGFELFHIHVHYDLGKYFFYKQDSTCMG